MAKKTQLEDLAILLAAQRPWIPPLRLLSFLVAKAYSLPQKLSSEREYGKGTGTLERMELLQGSQAWGKFRSYPASER